MAVDWMRNGPELLLGLDRRAGTPLAHQLQERLRDAIRSGRLERGERLPASRALAVQLGVSRGVVVDTYAQLESEGYLRSAQGSGTVVASSGGDGRPAERSRPAPPRFDVDFEYGVPDLRSFPMRDWLWAMGVAGRTATAVDLGDEHGAGAAQLREVLAAYLRRVRGAVADPDELFVCAGFRYGLNLVLRALLAEGVTTAAVEDPGPVDHEAIARRSSMRVVPVPVDELG
ncbi:MAG: GntR family transcriptional regulator, partial [Actinomycetales bacterium]